MDRGPWPTFGAWVMQRRRELDLTREELSGLLFCAVPTLRKIENGQRRASKDLARRLAEALGISTQDEEAFVRWARGRDSSAGATRLPLAPPTGTSEGARGHECALTVPGTPLIGREREIEEAVGRLSGHSCRLLNIVGIGGSGKTRLAIEIARKLTPWYKDGVWRVGLDDLREPADFVDRLISCLCPELGFGPEADRFLRRRLRPMEALIVLDSFEAVIEAAPLVDQILQECPGVDFLCTSRIRMRLRAEWLMELGGLPVTRPRGGPGCSPAARLFIESMRHWPVKRSATEDLEVIEAICRHLDGLPLGIEMAASWCRVLEPRVIEERLKTDIAKLSIDARDLPTRQRSLEAVLEGSWSLLSPPEAQALESLSLFPSSFTIQAAMDVTGIDLATLGKLMDIALVSITGEGRYILHALARRHLGGKLAASGRLPGILDRYLHYYSEMLGSGEGDHSGTGFVEFLNRVSAEHENIKKALGWALGEGSDQARVERALRLVTDTFQYWPARGKIGEGMEWLERGLRSGFAISPGVRAHSLNILGWFANFRESDGPAMKYLEESAAIYETAGDLRGLGDVYDTMGDVASRHRNRSGAIEFYRRSRQCYDEMGDRRRIGMSLASEGRLEIDCRRFEAGEELTSRALDILASMDIRRGVALCLNNKGRSLLLQGLPAAALPKLHASLSIWSDIGYQVDAAETILEIAVSAAMLGARNVARRLWMSARHLERQIGICYPSTDPVLAAGSSLHLEESARPCGFDGDLPEPAEILAQALSFSGETRWRTTSSPSPEGRP